MNNIVKIDQNLYLVANHNLLVYDKRNLNNLNMIKDIIDEICTNTKTTETSIKYNDPKFYRKIEFLLTNKCNLKCVYCYSQEERNTDSLDFRKAKLLIDQAIQTNILERTFIHRESHLDLIFHGGGEPSCESILMQEIVEYAKEQCKKREIELNLYIKSNGIFPLNFAMWLFEMDFVVNISLDGLKEDNDFQRPTLSNQGSFDIVARNLDYFNIKNSKFLIRSTITSKNLNKLIDFSDYIINRWNRVNDVIYEPIMIYDEQYSFLELTDPHYLIEILQENKELFDKVGINFNSTYDEYLLHDVGLCGGNRFNICIVTPNGDITVCQENVNTNQYFYGKVTDKEIIFDGKVINELKHEFQNLDSLCLECPIHKYCYGGCFNRRKSKNRSVYCNIQQHLYKDLFKRIIKNRKSTEYVNLVETQDLIYACW